MPNKKWKVFVSRKIPEPGITLLKRFFDVEISAYDRVLTKDELIKGISGKDALLCLLTDKIDSDVINSNDNLKIISNYAVGFDNVDVKTATEKGIIVANTPGVLTEAVAEHTFALLMAISRRIVEADKFARAGRYKGWEPFLLLGTQLEGKTLGILGLGRIGTSVAHKAVKGMGMNVIYNDVNRNTQFEDEFNAKFMSKEDVVRNADFLSLHVPLLPATFHLIGDKEFNMMKNTAYLINTSRGPVVDENALVKALKEKRIAGAAIDVFEFEPNLADGLAQLDNVVLTPHIASATVEARSAMAKLAAENVIAVFNGSAPPALVNREVLGKNRAGIR